jgi:hypothetical protein
VISGLRRLGFRILVPDTMTFRWDGGAAQRSSDAGSSTCSAEGCSVGSVAHDPRRNDQKVHNWRQYRIDRGTAQALTTPENADLAVARRSSSRSLDGCGSA